MAISFDLENKFKLRFKFKLDDLLGLLLQDSGGQMNIFDCSMHFWSWQTTKLHFWHSFTVVEALLQN